jgi:UDP-N-acetyl-D-galactosamine dehydrogenase
VLEAAGTKWNFLPFRPGLVGGHCIGVDPYYLTHKAEEIGYHSQVILAGRKINDNMGAFVANKVVKLMIKKSINVNTAKALVLGITFKENCPDIRNSKVIDIITELQDFGVQVDVYDPMAEAHEVKEEYGVNLIEKISEPYDTIILAVSHNVFQKINLTDWTKPQAVIYDVKATLDKHLIDGRL